MVTLALALVLLARLVDGDAAGGCISPVSLVPAMGQGDAAELVAVYRHCEDATAFRVVQLWVGEAPTPSGARVNLGYEAGMFTLENGGSCTPGEPVVLHSTYGSFECSASTVTLAGSDITVRWSVGFDVASFAGSHGVWFVA